MFQASGVQHTSSMDAIFKGIFLFMALGFERIDDDLVSLFCRSGADGCRVTVSVGPRGLVRTSLDMMNPALLTAQDMCQSLAIFYNQHERTFDFI